MLTLCDSPLFFPNQNQTLLPPHFPHLIKDVKNEREAPRCAFFPRPRCFKMCKPEMLRKRTRAGSAEEPTADNSKPTAPRKPVNGYALTRKVVSHHAAANDAWVINKGSVFDVTVFLESHPGGADILLDKLGADVTSVMEGVDGKLHTHSAFAYKLLAKYKIGELVDKEEGDVAIDGNIDPDTGETLVKWDQPILHQVGMLGVKYDRWIHSFPTTDHTVKMFANDTIENMTKCPWYIPLFFWIPIIIAESVHYVYLIDGLRNLNVLLIAAMATIGAVCWLLFEYTLHRFVFHMETTGYLANIVHFIIHGHHHITPMDFDRLVFPPVPAMMLALPFWMGAPRILGTHAGYPWLIGFALGYLVYDMTHFWIHHAVPKNVFFKMQKRRHVHHHYFQHTVNFGISNPLFDVVFGTLEEPQS